MLKDFLAGLVEQASMRLAVAGDDVPGRANFIYAELGGAGGTVIECRVGAVHPNAGDSIYVMRESPMQAAGWREAFWLRDGSDTALPAPVVGSIYVTGVTLLTDDDAETLTDDDTEDMRQ